MERPLKGSGEQVPIQADGFFVLYPLRKAGKDPGGGEQPSVTPVPNTGSGRWSGVATVRDGVIEEIKSRIDIVQLVSEYVSLKKKGNRFWGLCPFHHEDTPSFSVLPDKQIFYCFGCNAGGDAFKFIQLKENLAFPDSLKILADRAGVSLDRPDLTPEERERSREREMGYQALALAAAYFHRQLSDSDGGRPALDYLRRRGLTDETISRFQLGWAADDWDILLKGLGRKGFPSQILARAGLVTPRGEGKAGYYDRFRGRVIFPIWDIRGRVIGFGGRTMDDSRGPKYLNSPEGPFFSKGRNLYALHLAKNAMRSRDQAIIVEGYMDAIAAHQAGVENTVASLGTALTADQGKLLLQQTTNVVIAYDSDTAGQNATLRGLDILVRLGCQVKVLDLPEGKDPDEFLKARGSEAFNEVLEKALPLVDFKIALLRAGHDPSTPQGKAAVVRQVLPVLVGLKDAVQRDEYLRKLARDLDVSEEAVRSELRKLLQNRGRATPYVPAAPGASFSSGVLPSRHTSGKVWHNIKDNFPQTPDGDVQLSAAPASKARVRAERQLVALMLSEWSLVTRARAALEADQFADPACRTIVEGLYLAQGRHGLGETASGAAGPLDSVLANLADESAVQVAVELAASGTETIPGGKAPCERILQDCINAIKEHRMRRRIEEIKEIIRTHEKNGATVDSEVLHEYQSLVRMSKKRH